MTAAQRAAAGWRAQLALAYERQRGKTILATRRHDGPLVVQKPLYPEGDAVCHTIVVHPPGGIAGGDELSLSASVAEGAAALLTTPGASKWYRSGGPWAKQNVVFDVSGTLEWLPQETIFYNGAHAHLQSEIRLARNALFLGWEILCLGRTGSGERYAAGTGLVATRIWRDGKLVWNERGRIEGDGTLLSSRAGFGGRSVCGTLLAAAPEISDALLAACRDPAPASGEAAVTRMPGLLAARFLGDSSEAVKRYFARLWAMLRPALAGRDACEPRIWRT